MEFFLGNFFTNGNIIFLKIFRWQIRRLIKGLSGLLPKVKTETPSSIVCWIAGGWGDRLMALPAIRELRKKYPRAFFRLVFFHGELPGIEAEFPDIFIWPTLSAVERFRFLRKSTDLCFVNSVGIFHVSLELCVFRNRAAVRIGPRIRENGKENPLIGHVYNRPYFLDEALHETAINLGAVSQAASTLPASYLLVRHHNDKASLKTDLIRVGVHPGAHQDFPVKKWPKKNFHSFIGRLQAEFPIEILLMGSPAEKKLLAEIREGFPNISVFIGKNLAEFHKTLQTIQVMVGNDSGPCHAAAALGIPVVVLMGPTNPKRCSPVGSQIKVLQADCEGKPFCFYSGTVCPRGTCLGKITPQQTAEAVAGLLKPFVKKKNPAPEKI